MCFHWQLGEEEGMKEGFGSALRDSMWQKRLSITETRQGQELHVLKSLSLVERVDEGSLQCIMFAINGREKMIASTSAVMLSRAAT